MKGIAVYCASSSHLEPRYYDLAREMGALIAQKGYTLINGGGKFGLMDATIDGCRAFDGQCIGVLPEFMDAQGWAHDGLTEKIITTTMHTRKEKMAQLATAGAIALPGGIGTLDELAEIMTWRQLHLYNHPVVLLNYDGFYDPLIHMMDRMAQQHFLRNNMDLYYPASSALQAMNLIESR